MRKIRNMIQKYIGVASVLLMFFMLAFVSSASAFVSQEGLYDRIPESCVLRTIVDRFSQAFSNRDQQTSGGHIGETVHEKAFINENYTEEPSFIDENGLTGAENIVVVDEDVGEHNGSLPSFWEVVTEGGSTDSDGTPIHTLERMITVVRQHGGNHNFGEVLQRVIKRSYAAAGDETIIDGVAITGSLGNGTPAETIISNVVVETNPDSE